MERDLMLVAVDGGQVLVPRLCRTETVLDRLVGLLGREALADDEGLWLTRCGSIHTCFMRFALDAVYLDAAMSVCRVVTALQPWRVSACPGASEVIELPAGAARRVGIVPGMVVMARCCV